MPGSQCEVGGGGVEKDKLQIIFERGWIVDKAILLLRF